jgi:hypothetical protein
MENEKQPTTPIRINHAGDFGEDVYLVEVVLDEGVEFLKVHLDGDKPGEFLLVPAEDWEILADGEYHAKVG